MAAWKAQGEIYKRHPLIWLLGTEGIRQQVFTQDEHDPEVIAKPFPDKPYLREAGRLWLATKMNLWEKSRQMMASWLFCALYLHDTQFISQHGGRRLRLLKRPSVL